MSNKNFDFGHMRQSINRVLEDTFSLGGPFSIPIDIIDTEASLIVVTVPLVGIIPEKLDVSINSDILTISGETQPELDYPEDVYLKRERRYGRFQRRVTLPYAVDPDLTTAELKHHILKITLPKVRSAEPKVIHVKSNSDQPQA